MDSLHSPHWTSLNVIEWVYVLVSSYANCASTFGYRSLSKDITHTHTTSTFPFVWFTWNLSSTKFIKIQNIHRKCELCKKLCSWSKNEHLCSEDAFLARLLQLHLILWNVSFLFWVVRLGLSVKCWEFILSIWFWMCVCVLVFMFMNVILKNSEQEICGISHLIVV